MLRIGLLTLIAASLLALVLSTFMVRPRRRKMIAMLSSSAMLICSVAAATWNADHAIRRAPARECESHSTDLATIAPARTHRSPGAATVIGKQAHAIQCDVASADSVRAAFAQIHGLYEQVHVLINNAAVFEPSLIAGE